MEEHHLPVEETCLQALEALPLWKEICLEVLVQLCELNKCRDTALPVGGDVASVMTPTGLNVT